MSYIVEHLAEAAQVLQKLDIDSIERMTDILAKTRQSGGRLFILGVGGSAAGQARKETAHSATAAIELHALPHVRLPAAQASDTSTDRSREEECSICLVAYTPGDELRDLPCRHCFHRACIDEWLLRKNRPLETGSQVVHRLPMCPLCKAVPVHIPTPLGAQERRRRAGGGSSPTSSRSVLPT